MALGSGSIVVELARKSVQRLMDRSIVRQIHTISICGDRDFSIFRRTLDMRVARFVMGGVRAVAFMLIEQLCFAFELVNGEILRIILVNRAAVRLQMCQMTPANRIAADTDRLIIPTRTICQQKTSTPAARAANLSLDVGLFRIERCTEDAAIALKQHVAFDLDIALRRSSVNAVTGASRIDEYLALPRDMHGFRIRSGHHASAADTDFAVIRGIEKIFLILLDIDKPLDVDEGASR